MMRIVFMGTPDFAVASLRTLVEQGRNVVGVVTMPDKPAGRGHKPQTSAVKKYALEQGLPVLQPERLKGEDFLAELRALRADIQVVVAFRMLPEVVWSMPPRGTFNLHASLLPQYRGAAPINRAIMNGDTKTGVTTFMLSHEIDTGKLMLQQRVAITPDDTAGTLHDTLMHLGAQLVIHTLDAIASNEVTLTAQEEVTSDEPLREAPKLFKESYRIPWTKESEEVRNHVRGLSPYPAATALLCPPQGEAVALKIYEVTTLPTHSTLPVGSLLTDGKHHIDVVVGGGEMIRILSLQPAGKKRMTTTELLNGYKLTNEFHVE